MHKCNPQSAECSAGWASRACNFPTFSRHATASHGSRPAASERPCFVSGHRFSDAVIRSLSLAPLGAALMQRLRDNKKGVPVSTPFLPLSSFTACTATSRRRLLRRSSDAHRGCRHRWNAHHLRRWSVHHHSSGHHRSVRYSDRHRWGHCSDRRWALRYANRHSSACCVARCIRRSCVDFRHMTVPARSAAAYLTAAATTKNYARSRPNHSRRSWEKDCCATIPNSAWCGSSNFRRSAPRLRSTRRRAPGC